MSDLDGKLPLDGSFSEEEFWRSDKQWAGAFASHDKHVYRDLMPAGWALTSTLKGAVVTLQSAGSTPVPLCFDCGSKLSLDGGQPTCPLEECPSCKVTDTEFHCPLTTLFITTGRHGGPRDAL